MVEKVRSSLESVVELYGHVETRREVLAERCLCYLFQALVPQPSTVLKVARTPKARRSYLCPLL